MKIMESQKKLIPGKVDVSFLLKISNSKNKELNPLSFFFCETIQGLFFSKAISSTVNIVCRVNIMHGWIYHGCKNRKSKLKKKWKNCRDLKRILRPFDACVIHQNVLCSHFQISVIAL